MKIDMLRRKAKIVGDLMGKTLYIGSWGRKYRADDEREQGVFTPAYLPAQELWNRLDFAQTALEILQRKHELKSHEISAKYTPHIPTGYRFLGNSPRSKEQALKDYRHCLQAGEEITIEPFLPDGQLDPQHPDYSYTIKWALFAHRPDNADKPIFVERG